MRAAIRDLFASPLIGAADIAMPASVPMVDTRQEHARHVHQLAIRCMCPECVRLDAAERWGAKWQLRLF